MLCDAFKEATLRTTTDHNYFHSRGQLLSQKFAQLLDTTIVFFANSFGCGVFRTRRLRGACIIDCTAKGDGEVVLVPCPVSVA